MRRASGSGHQGVPMWMLLLPTALLTLLVVYPVMMLLLQSVWPDLYLGRFAGFMAPYAELVRTPDLLALVYGSLRWAAATVVVALVLGAPIGWLLARTDLPGRGVVRVGMLIPLMTPPYVLALAYILLMQRGGLVDDVFGEMPAWAREAFFSFSGITFVMAISSVGYVALAVESALLGTPSRLEQAAETLGAKRWQVATTIVLPLLAPALANAGLIVFLDTISNFGVPAVLGPRTGVRLLPAEIYYLVTSWPVDLPLATALSSILIFMAAIGLLINRAITGRASSTLGRQATMQRRLHLGPIGRVVAWGYLLLIFVAATGAPFAAAFVSSIEGAWEGEGRAITWSHYGALLEPESRGFGAIMTSLWLSGVAATICLGLGTLVAYLNSRVSGRWMGVLDGVATLPRILPKIVLAVGLILAWNAPWMVVRVYGTVWMLLVAYVALYVSDSLRLTDARMRQIPVRLEHAAESLGASRARAIRTVVMPMMRPALVAAWGATFVVSFRDLVASVMLLPPGVDTVGSYIFAQFEQGEMGRAMAMAIVSTVIGIVVLLVVRPREETRSAR